MSKRPRSSRVLWEQAKEAHRFCTRHLNLLRNAFRELLEYKNVAANFQLQRKVLALAIVALLVATASLLPEETRESIWSALDTWLRTAATYILDEIIR